MIRRDPAPREPPEHSTRQMVTLPEDRVELSSASRRRLDWTAPTETVRAQTSDPKADEMRELRQLYQRDLEMRTRASPMEDLETIKMPPVFEVEIGPLGRAYAVAERELEVERPRLQPLKAVPEGEVRPGFDGDVGPPGSTSRELASVAIRTAEADALQRPSIPTAGVDPGERVAEAYRLAASFRGTPSGSGFDDYA